MDKYDRSKRSEIMRAIKSKDTKPEKIVRSVLHSMGFRFRLHRKDLPGNPDIVLPKYKSVIFVHGCFWHRHDCPKGRSLPKSRIEFWIPKLERNEQRNMEVRSQLKNLGWDVLTIWECETHDENAVRDIVLAFLEKAKQLA